MNELNPILSICIPTFNRAKYLLSCLLSIYENTVNLSSFEVVVSDNASSDNTESIVSLFYKFPNFRYIKSDENVGAVKNILKVVQNAKGEFCWIIGDDDFILPDKINNIIELLKSSDADFIYAKVGQIHINEFDLYRAPFCTSHLKKIEEEFKFRQIEKFEELLTPAYSIIFLGEIMASIFRRRIWLSHTLANADNPMFEHLESTYPHTVIFANCFVGRPAIYIETETILALEGAREWWDKVGFIIINHIKDLLCLFEAKGVSKSIMTKCWNEFIKLSVPYAVNFQLHPNCKYREKVRLLDYSIFIAKKNLRISAELFFKNYMVELKKWIKSMWRRFKAFIKYKILKYPILKTEYERNLDLFERSGVILASNDFSIAGQIYIYNHGKISIGHNFKANSAVDANPIGGDMLMRLVAYTRNSTITIGSNVGISNSTIVSWNSVTIEDNVLIGGGCRIWDTDFHSLDSEIRSSNFDYDIKTLPIVIKRNAFIGAGSIILKGVTIGCNSIIGAGSVVSTNIPDNVIAAGNPCKIIRSLVVE